MNGKVFLLSRCGHILMLIVIMSVNQLLPVAASDTSSSLLSSSRRIRGRKIRTEHEPRSFHHHHHHHHHHHNNQKENVPLKADEKASVPPPTNGDNRVKLPQVLVNVGERVLVHNILLGTVMYVGQTSFAKGIWVGISLDQPKGKNDGTVKGHKYFQCEPKHGLFTKPEHVIRYQQDDTTQSKTTRTTNTNNSEKKNKAKKKDDIVTITGKGGQEVPIENLKDLKTKYLHDLDEKMYGLMHSGNTQTKSTKTPNTARSKVVGAGQQPNVLKVQNAKVSNPQEMKSVDTAATRNNDLFAPTPYSGINQPVFGAQPSSLSQQLQTRFQPGIPAFNQQLLEAPLPMMLLELNSKSRYDKDLDSTMIGLPKVAKGIGSAYTLKDLEASGMNKAFDSVDTTGLPDELVDQLKSGKQSNKIKKNQGHLSELDNVFVKMLDHNSHGKNKFFVPDNTSKKKEGDDDY